AAVWVAVAAALASSSTNNEAPERIEENQELQSQEERDKKTLILAQINPTQCTTNDAIHTLGTCMPLVECRSTGGVAKGYCVSGLAVCCLATRTCNTATRQNNTYFVNPSSPELTCPLTINLMSNNICQLRLDFIEFILSQPSSDSVCDTELLIVSGGSSNLPAICGTMTGQHIYYTVDQSVGPVKLTIDRKDLTSSGNVWNIKVTQIPCDSRYRAPEGCLQYYTQAQGTINSFNYANTATVPIQAETRQLANQDYSVCIKQADNACGITYTSNNVGGVFSFTLTGEANSTSAGEFNKDFLNTNCTTDYIVIPGGFYTHGGSESIPADRYCGVGFPTSVVSTFHPFLLYVRTDGTEDMDMNNRGFSLNYVQTDICE
ncbi:hypothetical protein OTU49_011905, partial [Cherax quadricarinatus]